jgi:hypothetical protein
MITRIKRPATLERFGEFRLARLLGGNAFHAPTSLGFSAGCPLPDSALTQNSSAASLGV